MSPERIALRHDVAKYLTRVARNLEGRAISTELAAMMVRDLYEAPGGGRPERRFDELAKAIDGDAAAAIRALFAKLAALEPAARAHQERALRSAADLALEIDRRIHDATSEVEHP